ncbi:MAG TPA: hypothetical protein VGL38_13080 [bacterium]|jgi:hypothetical protein
MSKAMVIRGICVSCKYGPQCSNHHGAAVMDCAQFEGYAYAPSRTVHESLQWHEVTDMGLCPQCDAESVCTRVRPESGVWRCADFR